MCGIVGISNHPEAARLAYLGLYSLQHRGQESAGIVSVDEAGIARTHRGMGLVSDVFSEDVIRSLEGTTAIVMRADPLGLAYFASSAETTSRSARRSVRWQISRSVALRCR